MMPSNSFPADTLSPAPLLDAFENFQGCYFDLDRNIRTSADELKKLKAELCKQMLALGLSAGDLIITAVPNGPLFAAIWAAVLEMGASPILVHGETPGPELQRMAERWGAQFVVRTDIGDGGPGKAAALLEAREQGTLRWRRIEPSNAKLDQLRLHSVPLHVTSGTSGGPKIAVRPGPCAVAEPLHYIETLSINRADSILCAIPMSHAYAYGMCFLVGLLSSAELLFMKWFNPVLVRRALSQKNVSVFPAVPVLLDTLLVEDAISLNGPRPRLVLSAGAPLKRKTLQAFHERYGIAILPLYGTTETGGISIGRAEDGFDGSVGPPLKGVEVDLSASSENGTEAEAKILRVRSSSMMAGYLEGAAVSRSAIHDGWFETGDLARIDANGRIHLQGRLSEVINTFGFKVVPQEVEDVIAMLPQVAEVKVYRARWRGQDVVEAAVVCRGHLDEEQVLKHCEKHLVGYKCPTAIRFLGALPRTASGKVAVERLSECP